MFFAQNAREQKVKGNKITCLVNKCTCYESDAMVQRPKKRTGRCEQVGILSKMTEKVKIKVFQSCYYCAQD